MSNEFDAWLKRCDAVCLKLIGMSINDFPDQHWHDWFDGGIIPSEAVGRLFQNEGVTVDSIVIHGREREDARKNAFKRRHK